MSSDKRQQNDYNLLPDAYHYQTRVRQLRKSWMAVFATLTAVLLGITIATGYEQYQQRLLSRDLAAAAAPLMDLRKQVSFIQADTQRREHLCDLVEQSRPNDDLLQTLASIAFSTQSNDVMVDSVRIRLPIESDSDQSAEVLIGARAKTESSKAWVNELAKSKRIVTPQIVVEERAPNISACRMKFGKARAMRLRGAPTITRVLP